MARRTKHWSNRSTASKFAHVFERSGLALTGCACGLFVAAYLVKSNVAWFGSDALAFALMAIGASGFYLGIDLPPRASSQPFKNLSNASDIKIDAAELLSAAGTFLAAAEATASVFAIISGDTLGATSPLIIGFGWILGAAMQIGSGIIARMG